MKAAYEGEREVGWHRSGGQWQYCHKRSVADQGQHIANQGNASNPNPNPNPMEGNGAVRKSSSPMEVCSNGQNLGPVESGDGDGPGAHGNPIARSSRDAHAQEQDHISMRLNEMQDSILAPIKEDLSEWITRIVGVDINPDSFIEVLDSGVVLCSIAKLIEKHAQQYAKEGKLNEPLPNYRLKCNTRAKSGTWFSRDNVTGFLGWCKAYGMADETMFDSEDLVSHKHEKPVVNCVLELARLGWKFGIEPPNLIRMEREIEEEVFLPPPPPPPFIPKPVEVVEVPVVVEKPVEKPVEKKPDKVDLHKEVRRVAQNCKCQEYVNRISEGVYDVFGKRVFIRVVGSNKSCNNGFSTWWKVAQCLCLLKKVGCQMSQITDFLEHCVPLLLHGKHLMVRVGGGWDTFENYLMHHDPVQVFEFHREGSRENVNKPPATKNNFEGYLVIKSKYKS